MSRLFNRLKNRSKPFPHLAIWATNISPSSTAYLELTLNKLLKEVKTASWKEKLLYFLGRRRGFIVQGNSMSPTLEDSTAVLIQMSAKIKKGDIVLAQHPYKKSVKILKRVAEITDDGKLNLIGDNPSESSDSRGFGLIATKNVIGKVVCRLK